MAETTKVVTKMQIANGRAIAHFDGHPHIAVEGLTGIEGHPNAWSPIHLLVASIESCYYLTFAAVAEKMRVGITEYRSQAEGSFASTDGKHKEVTELLLRLTVGLANEADRAKLPQLAKLAEEHCPVARSVKTKVRVELA